MITVYGYQFEAPRPVEARPQTNYLAWIVFGVAAWWLWKSGRLAEIVGRRGGDQ